MSRLLSTITALWAVLLFIGFFDKKEKYELVRSALDECEEKQKE